MFRFTSGQLYQARRILFKRLSYLTLGPHISPHTLINSPDSLDSTHRQTNQAKYDNSEIKAVAKKSNLKVVMLHCIFGSKNNWRSVCQNISNQCGIDFIIPDLPNHGDNEHSKHPMGLADVSRAILSFLVESSFAHGEMDNQYILMGHSYGGKVCMRMALDSLNCIEMRKLVKGFIAIDMWPTSTVAVELPYYLDILRGMDLTCRNRSDLDYYMFKAGIAYNVIRSFFQTNLLEIQKDANTKIDAAVKWKWKFSLRNLEYALYDWNLPPVTCQQPFRRPCLFIQGDATSYPKPLDTDDVMPRYFPKAKTILIKDAGHLVHLDQPEILNEAVIKFLNGFK